MSIAGGDRSVCPRSPRRNQRRHPRFGVAGTQAQMIEMLGTDARTEQPARVLGVMRAAGPGVVLQIDGRPAVGGGATGALTQFSNP